MKELGFQTVLGDFLGTLAGSFRLRAIGLQHFSQWGGLTREQIAGWSTHPRSDQVRADRKS